MVQNKSVGSRIFDLLNHLLFIGVIVACLLPVIHVVFASFSDPTWVMGQRGFILLPHKVTLGGYKQVFSDGSIMSGYMNTFIYVFASTFIGMFITVVAAYALSRKDFIWANTAMLLITFTMLFSGGIIPLYLVVTQTLDLYNSRWAVILPTCVNAFNLIIVRTGMASVPESLEESAMLDGAGRFTILFLIIMPLCKATLATVILYYAVGHWNSWFNAMIYLSDRSKYPLQLILKELLITSTLSTSGTASASDNSADTLLYKQLIKYCAIVVSCVPVFIFYPFIQKYFESGVMIGAVKG